MKNTRILITGVGGQGTLLTSRILGRVAQMRGMDVKLSEVHGMSQRGGSVVTYVTLGEKVYSPLIEPGQADFMLTFEQLEALRYAYMVAPGGHIIVNTQRISPMPVVTGAAAYPEGILETLAAKPVHIHPVDALAMAMEAGNPKTVNTAMIGALARWMQSDKELFLEAVRTCVPEKTRAVNEKAFLIGWEHP